MCREIETEIAYICDKCGTKPSINDDKSNENWIYYDIDEPCLCGGKWIVDILPQERYKKMCL